MRASLLAAGLVAGLLAPAAAQADVIVDPVPGRDVDQLGGALAWSRPAGDGVELVLRREDGSTEVVATQQADPQQDLGTDADGRVVLVFLRCAEECRVVQRDVQTGSTRVIAGGRDRTPALWDGVYAFSRSYPPDGREVVYLRRLGGERPSRRIWTTGRIATGEVSNVTGLDLGTGGVAFGHDEGVAGELLETELWAKRPGRPTRLVARVGSGAMSIARHGGPSVVGHTLLWTYHRQYSVPAGLLLRRDLRTGRTREATVPGLAFGAAGDALRPSAPIALGTAASDEGGGTDAVRLLDPAPTFRPARRGIGIRG